MKRLIVAVVLVLSTVAFVAADDFSAGDWDSFFKSGDTSVSLGVGVGLGSTFSIGAFPGFEQTVFDTKLGDTVPLAIGVAAKGLVNLYLGSTSGLVVGAGAFVPFHFSLKGLDLIFFNQLDFYVAPGIAASFRLGGVTDPFNIHFGQYAGVNYFLSESMAIFLEEVYWWGAHVGGTIGVTLKL